MTAIRFTVEKRDAGGARAGMIGTPHGTFTTPAFTAVGTKATVKSVMPHDLAEHAGVEVALANTYHLFLQPGEEVVRDAGGLHRFMNWDGPLMTDSGGFQVFSLGAGYGKGITKFVSPAPQPEAELAVYDRDVATQHGKLALVDEEGVTFTSHIDGGLHRFTPERSVEIQHALGADIFFAFDECTSPTADKAYQEEALSRTTRWASRSLTAHRRNLAAQDAQAIFGIVQGGRYADLRSRSAQEIGAMNFDGFGIGGSFSKADLGEALAAAIRELPEEKPRHLLGIGEPEDIFEGVSEGIDMFDCVAPTRIARNGTIYTARGKLNLLNEKYVRDFSPLDPDTGGYASSNFTKAYLAHLYRADEMLAATIASIHNLFFLTSLMKKIRNAVIEGKFPAFRDEFLVLYSRS